MNNLRPYQIEDAIKLSQLEAGACFNEMRTGKTPTALEIVRLRGFSKFVITCPASAVLQWQDEVQNWLNRPCVALIGTAAKRAQLLEEWTDALVVSYGVFKTTAKTKGIVQDILLRHPDALILDEAHRIKNPKSKLTEAIFQTISIPYRLALTGTPAPNKAHEVYSILHWLYPKQYRTYWSFIGDYFETIRLSKGRAVFMDIRGFKPGMRLILQKDMAKFSTERKLKDVLPWLPEKDITNIKFTPTADQRRYLDELKTYFETENVVTQTVLDRLIRYRQICLHPGLLKLKGGSPKMDWVKSFIEDYPETPILIFSKFTSFLKLLAEELRDKKIGIIIGETPILQRNEYKEDFQAGRLNVLLLNIDAGKEALTLDRAECEIFMDKYPPIGDIEQAEARFIATTEARALKPHRIINLMMANTYDEHIFKLLQERKSETDVINDYNKYLHGR